MVLKWRLYSLTFICYYIYELTPPKSLLQLKKQSENGNDSDFHDEMQDTMPQSIDDIFMTETITNNTLIFDSCTTIENDRKLLNFYNTTRRWKIRINGRVIVPYTTEPGVPGVNSFRRRDKKKIKTALDDLEARTGCLKFVKRSNQKDYIKVFNYKRLCSAPRTTRTDIVITLGKGCLKKGLIQHEFMHALGFTHEQSRPDRNTYVTVLVDNIKIKYESEFTIANQSETLGSPYDYNSIMHYAATQLGIDGQTTIQTKNGEEIGNRDEATVNDIKKLKLLYQCENGPREWNSLEQSPCTSNCRCRNEDIGCGSSNNACQGSLICSDNKCIVGAAPVSSPSSPPSPPPPSSSNSLIYNKKKRDGRFYCIALYGRGTKNEIKVWYSPCNLSPGKN
jgi:hypothetical protein